MQSRFTIALMSVAGAALLFSAGLLFGLGVMSSPKRAEHTQIALANAPVKVARRETTGSGDPGRPLTPLTPVHPGVSEQEAKAAEPQTQPAAPARAPVAQAPAPAAAVPPQAAVDAPKPADAAPKEAKAVPAVAPAPAKPAPVEKTASADATPVSLHTKNSCDIAACSRAYKSFRESDCTYQPYSGPRQLCVGPPGAKEASRAAVARTTPVRVHHGVRDVEVEDVPREGAAADDAAPSRDQDERVVRRDFHRDFAADGEDDGIDDSRVIVRRGDDDGRYDDRGGWHRSFYAPVEVDDDDQ